MLLILLKMAGCKEPYEPSGIKGDTGYLVVDGMIVNGTDSTFITLTRTTGWHDSTNIVYEQNALVQVEGADKSIYQLTGKPNGVYTIGGLHLKSNVDYRLRIVTTNGNVYASEYVPVLATPQIDSVSWKQETNLLNENYKDLSIYVNTHDPDNKTRYYLWQYVETWKYHAAIQSKVMFYNYDIIKMTREDQDKMYYCWQSDSSKSILTDTSIKLAQDVIQMKQLTYVTGNSLKKSLVYSILVKQYAITQSAFEFYEIMKKNTEQTGSLFDPQPSALKGNITNLTHPADPVIGYVSIATQAAKRIYINKDFFYNYPEDCVVQNLYEMDVSKIPYPQTYYPVDFIYDHGNNYVIGYIIAPSSCVNCEKNGGKNTKPYFWPADM